VVIGPGWGMLPGFSCLVQPICADGGGEFGNSERFSSKAGGTLPGATSKRAPKKSTAEFRYLEEEAIGSDQRGRFIPIVRVITSLVTGLQRNAFRIVGKTAPHSAGN